MDADECARAAEMLGLDVAIACHYLEPDEEVGRFVRLVEERNCRAVAPLVGQTIVVDDGNIRVEPS